MKKIFAIFLLFFLMIFLSNCARNFNEVSIDNGKKIIKIKVEVADDNSEREMGLMFRKQLDENSGMLFVFDEENYQAFWMKNTLIPLDMIFIDKNLKIVDIKHAVPCKEEPCDLYKPSMPSKFVLEVNENFTVKNNIKIGDSAFISLVK